MLSNMLGLAMITVFVMGILCFMGAAVGYVRARLKERKYLSLLNEGK